jgi:hypothetical protein
MSRPRTSEVAAATVVAGKIELRNIAGAAARNEGSQLRDIAYATL